MHKVWLNAAGYFLPYKVFIDTGSEVNVVAESLAMTCGMDYEHGAPEELTPYGNVRIEAIGYVRGVRMAMGCWPMDRWVEADFYVLADEMMPEREFSKMYIGKHSIMQLDHFHKIVHPECL